MRGEFSEGAFVNSYDCLESSNMTLLNAGFFTYMYLLMATARIPNLAFYLKWFWRKGPPKFGCYAYVSRAGIV